MLKPSVGLPHSFIWLNRSNLAAQFTEQLVFTATPLVAVLYLAADATITGALLTLYTLPFLIFSLPAGILVDRFSRRQLLIVSELFRLLALTVMIFVVQLDSLTTTLLMLLTCCIAMGTVIYPIALPAVVQSWVPSDSFPTANRWLELSKSLAFAVGPALAGLLLDSGGALTLYLLSASLSAAAVGLLFQLPEVPLNRSSNDHSLWGEVKQGISLILHHPLLRTTVLTSVIFNLSWFILLAVYVPYAIANLYMTATETAASIATVGAGMVVGAWVGQKIGQRLHWGIYIMIGPFCAVLAAAVMFLTTGIPSKLFAYLSMFLFGFGSVIWTIATTTLRQMVTPAALIGRVFALIMLVSFGARPVGAAIGALLASETDLSCCLLVVLVGFLLQFMVILFSPVSRLKKLNDY